MQIKKTPARHKAEEEYLLTTKLYCGKCQSFMVGESGHSQSKGTVHRYYKCITAKRHKTCDKKTVRKEWIEDLVIDYVRKILFDDELLETIAEKVVNVFGKENETLPLLRKQYDETQKAIDNLLFAIQQGILTPSTKQRMQELEQQKNELSTQIIKKEMAKITNLQCEKGTLSQVIHGADVFIGVSAPNTLTADMVKTMAKDPVIFACANPEPEIYPEEAIKAGAAVVSTGRSDYPNQVNNVLCFPALFRGALDVRAADINDEMKVAAAYAIASLVDESELNAEYILPHAFDPRIKDTVAAAVAEAARKTGVARI